ncbi:MAG: TraB domain-containing protein [Promethearchaeota archaeon]
MNSESIVNQVQSICDRIFLIGSIHVAQNSAELVEKAINKIKPACVMLELDEKRYETLHNLQMQDEKPLENIEDKNLENPNIKENAGFQEQLAFQDSNVVNDDYLFDAFESQSNPTEIQSTPRSDSHINSHANIDAAMDDPEHLFNELKKVQEKIGDLVGMTPGVEMLKAMEIVEKLKIPVRLIDRPIDETMDRLATLQEEGAGEHIRMFDMLEKNSDQLTAKEIQDLMLEFQKPGVIEEILSEFEKEFPKMAKILLEERNEYMVNEILDYEKNHPNNRILIIIGAGHLKNIMDRLENLISPKKEEI